jgi:hypothetical protein
MKPKFLAINDKLADCKKDSFSTLKVYPTEISLILIFVASYTYSPVAPALPPVCL